MIKIKLNKQNSLHFLFLLILVLGLVSRIWNYAINGVFEDDECRLAIALFQSDNFFLPLLAGQSAPPIFSLITYNFAKIFNFNEYALKFIPFIASIISLPLFYKLSKEYVQSKIGQMAGFFLFALCIPVIGYCSTFKQYSTDVLFGILCLYFLPKIKLKELHIKKLALFTFAIILLPFISLPTVFFLGAFFILNICKKLLFVFIPFGLIMGLYYFYNLHPSSVNMETIFPHYWDDGFLSFSIKSFLRLIIANLKFLFTPYTFTLFQLIMLFVGVVLAFKDEKYRLLLISFCLILLTSLLHIYPFLGRVALFTASIFILLMVKSFDVKSKKLFQTVIFIAFLGFFHYFSIFSYMKEYCTPNYSPNILIPILKYNYNPKKDIVLINKASVNSFIYYGDKLGFTRYYVSEIPSEDELEDYFKALKKDKNYWIFIVKDYKKAPNREKILKWAENQTVLDVYKDKDSILIYIKCS